MMPRALFEPSSDRLRSPFRIVALYGGVGLSDEDMIAELADGVDILIATPSCLQRVLPRCSLRLRFLSHLVLDDADTLLSTSLSAVCSRFPQTRF